MYVDLDSQQMLEGEGTSKGSKETKTILVMTLSDSNKITEGQLTKTFQEDDSHIRTKKEMRDKESDNVDRTNQAQEDDIEEEEDDVDFNPFLHHSPSSEGNSGISSEGEEEEEGEVEEGFTEEGKQTADVGQHYEESGLFGEGVFVELGSDGDQEEEDIYDDDEDEEDNEDEVEDEDEINEKEEYLEEITVKVEQIESSSFFPLRLDQKESKPLEAADGNVGEYGLSDSNGMECGAHATMIEALKRIEDSRLDRERETTEEEMMGHALEALPELKSLRDERFSMERHGPQSSVNEVELDAISKRTRAHYSLADMSLDQLEMFLQESDEEDYFQNVDDEEEYRKFLAAVKEQLEGKDQEKLQDDEEDDDEDDDADFEVEIEEGLGSDYEDASEKVNQKIKHQEIGRRPETREKTRERIQNKEKLLGLAKTPLRRLLPYTGSSNADDTIGEGNALFEGTSKGWQTNATNRGAVNGFTAHQIGQLYCLIHEHVQLLLQVFSLSILEPSRQQIAIDVHKMLMELAEKRDSILSWKRSAFPDFCFRRPYTHASVLEDHGVRVAGDVASISTSTTSLLTTVTEPTVDREMSGQHWVPTTSGPVRSLLDVAPLALVREFLADVAIVVEVYRRRHVESGDYHSQCEREALFPLPISEHKELKCISNMPSGFDPANIGHKSFMPPKKTMAATLVENTKKQCIALVPKEITRAMRRFFLLFNIALYPHKPPPVATANRLLFTEAEDQLLAMGLMIYNTDWGAIQQRFLPSKSTHQIFVRQKNRSSSKAPENCIKAVRRMKASPLTAEEVACIQEALRCFKLDWNKVWMFSVPHRDPSMLPRQLRLALGTQKSYKLDEASKERRRAYEVSRRSAKTSIKVNMKVLGLNKDGLEVFPEHNVNEVGEAISGDEDADDPGEAYIHEAFLADWKPCALAPPTAVTLFPSVGCEDAAACPSSPTNGLLSGHGTRSINIRNSQHPLQSSQVAHLQGSNLSLFPSSTSTNTTLETIQKSFLKRSLSTPLTPQCHQPRKRSCVQTVKLAPGLPSVNLPPHVRVISLSKSQAKKPAVNRASTTAQLQNGAFSSQLHNLCTKKNISSTTSFLQPSSSNFDCNGKSTQAEDFYSSADKRPRNAHDSSVSAFSRCKLYNGLSAETGSVLSETGNCVNNNQVCDKNYEGSERPQGPSDTVQASALQFHQEQGIEAPLHPLLLQQTVDPCLSLQDQSSDHGQPFLSPLHDSLSVQNTSPHDVHPLLQQASPAFHPFFGAPRAVQASGRSRSKLTLRTAPVRCTAPTQRGSLDFHPLLQHQVTPKRRRVNGQKTYSGKRLSPLESSPCTPSGSISHADGDDTELSLSISVARQESAHPTEAELQQPAIGSSEWVRSDTHALRSCLEYGQSSSRETSGQFQRGSDTSEIAHGGKKIFKHHILSQRPSNNENGRSICKKAKVVSGLCERKKRAPTKCVSDRELQIVSRSHKSRWKNSKIKSPTKNRAKTGEEVNELTGTNDPHLHIIMEQEELSDSDEDADRGVQFEYEEMVDSDIETSDSLHPIASADKEDCSIEFEEEEIGTDESEDENVDDVPSPTNISRGSSVIVSRKGPMLRVREAVRVEQDRDNITQSASRFHVSKNDRHRHDFETGEHREASRCHSKRKATKKVHEVSQSNHESGKLASKELTSKKKNWDHSRKIQEAGSSVIYDKNGSAGSLSLHQFLENSKAIGGLPSQFLNESKSTKFGRQSVPDTTAIEAAHVLAVIHQSLGENV
ncbi:hypothetical protein O6H91_22G011800 [Diphasiastrum complanatum]|uniref:Uncharacterized protein n=1 Tax=Diphasiastrum complanatum TaxID=34168 RepID=A0ACC2ACS9_DIPCM|nr:hypothetical protein O6H91_22G011800 [Diphasiastrum complanatum]